MDPDVPGGEVSSEEESCKSYQERKASTWPVDRLANESCDDKKGRKCKSKPPKSRGDGSDA